MSACKRILVIGIGQSLRGDDAAGLEAVRYWTEQYPATSGRAEIQVKVLESPGLSLLNELLEADAVLLVDAMQGGGAPVRCFRTEELAAFTTDSRSAHGLGVAETLLLGARLYPALQRLPLVIVGIEGENFSPGTPMSQTVSDLLPQVIEVIEQEVQRLQRSLKV